MKLGNRALARIVSVGIVLGAAMTGSVVLAGGASAAGSNSGGSICGTVWHDLNGDGYRQVDEPVIPGHAIGVYGGSRHVISGADGRYCFTGLPVGDYVLQSNDRSLIDNTAWTTDGRDSKFGRTTGLGYDPVDVNQVPIKITKKHGKYTHVDNFDSGFLDASVDLYAVQVIVAQSVPAGESYHVGDVIDVYGSVGINGNAAEQLGGTLTLPEGLTILDREGGTPSYVQGQQVIGDFQERRYPGDIEFIGARVRVDKPITAGEIKIETHRGVFPDTNPNNNVLTSTITAVG
jgi:hypothetical protein